MRSQNTKRAVLLDLDDTLFDHREGARRAVETLRELEPPLASQPLSEVERVNRLLLEEIHLRVLAGEIHTDGARIERMRRLLAHFGCAAPQKRAVAVAQAYRESYTKARREVPGARALLRELRRRGLRLAVVTNNTTQEQEEKMSSLGFAPLVDHLVVSEAVGSWKPDPRIFEVALRRLEVLPPEAVMVGDSWSSDILGARRAGIPSIWYNPLRLDPPDSSQLPIPQLLALEPAEEAAERILAVGPSEC